MISAIPDFNHQLNRKTLRPIVTVDLDTWHLDGQLCFLGDAAHAIFPFFGAGLNTSLEDLSHLMSLIDHSPIHDLPWATLFRAFQDLRKPNTDAIQALSKQRMQTFAHQMRDPSYRDYRETLDMLTNWFPQEFWSVERLIRFSKMPYSEVLRYSQTERVIVKEV